MSNYEAEGKSRIDLAFAKLIESLTNLVWIIPGFFVLQLVYNSVYGGNLEINADSLMNVLIGLIWLVFGLKVLDLIDKKFKPNLNASK